MEGDERYFASLKLICVSKRDFSGALTRFLPFSTQRASEPAGGPWLQYGWAVWVVTGLQVIDDLLLVRQLPEAHNSNIENAIALS